MVGGAKRDEDKENYACDGDAYDNRLIMLGAADDDQTLTVLAPDNEESSSNVPSL